MNSQSLTLAQLGAAVSIVATMLVLALGWTTSGLLVGDVVLVFGFMTAFWLLLHARIGSPRPTLRRATQPALVRTSARKGR